MEIHRDKITKMYIMSIVVVGTGGGEQWLRFGAGGVLAPPGRLDCPSGVGVGSSVPLEPLKLDFGCCVKVGSVVILVLKNALNSG